MSVQAYNITVIENLEKKIKDILTLISFKEWFISGIHNLLRQTDAIESAGIITFFHACRTCTVIV